MNTLLNREEFTDFRKELENYLISRFKDYYKTFDKRLRRTPRRNIKVSYVEENRIHIETIFDCGKKSGHTFVTSDEVEYFAFERNHTAILLDCLYTLSKETIINSAKKNEEKPFGFVIDYIKSNYSVPKPNGWDIADKVLEYFEIDNENF